MCHNDKIAAFPAPGPYQRKESGDLKYLGFGADTDSPSQKVGILTDIYGCNEFYQSFATYLSKQGWHAMLVDLFTDLGELPEITREAAFERRHKLRDRETCDRIEQFVVDQDITAVIGFCLGGNYVFELARRNVSATLVAYYPFPAGLPNQDEITPAFDYLNQLEKEVTVLIGDSDDSVGRDNISKLAERAKNLPCVDVRVYKNSGHGFLTQLDSEDKSLKANAEDSLSVCLQKISN